VSAVIPKGVKKEEEVSLSKWSMVDENGATEAMKGVIQKITGLRDEPWRIPRPETLVLSRKIRFR
jgi:hypothetical protein